MSFFVRGREQIHRRKAMSFFVRGLEQRHRRKAMSFFVRELEQRHRRKAMSFLVFHVCIALGSKRIVTDKLIVFAERTES